MRDFLNCFNIRLTRGKYALIDIDDAERVLSLKWSSHKGCAETYYARTTIRVDGKTKTMSMHRFIKPPPDGLLIDHKNRDGLDNRKGNLRFCTHAQNQQNRPGYSNRTSKYKGIHFHKWTNRWRAMINVNSKIISLGYYKTQEEAAIAYNEAAIKYHGEFAYINDVSLPPELIEMVKGKI